MEVCRLKTYEQLKSEKNFGEIRDLNTLKFFVLFIIKSLGGYATRAAIDEVALLTQSANYFDYSIALQELIEGEHIHELELPEKGLICANTSTGMFLLEQFQQNIPSSARRRVAQAVVEYNTRTKYDSEVRADIRTEDGTVFSDLSLSDKNGLLFRCSIAMPDKASAADLCEAYKKNPEGIYGALVNEITKALKPTL